MALDEVARRYADTLFQTRCIELRKQYVAHRALVIGDLAKRGFDAHNAGFYHSELTRVGIAHIDDVIQARADTLLAAYDQEKLPIDDEAAVYIRQETNTYADAQARNLTQLICNQLGQFNRPAGIAKELAGTIERAVSGTKARINFQLSALRDAAILAARAAAQHPIAPPELETRPREPLASCENLIVRLWHRSATWQWFATIFVGGACTFIFLEEYLLSIPLMCLAAISLLSRLIHRQHRKAFKVTGGIGIGLALAFILYTTIAIKGSKPWSHLQQPFHDLVTFLWPASPDKPVSPKPPSSPTVQVVPTEPPKHIVPETPSRITPPQISEPNGFLQIFAMQYVTGDEFFTAGRPLQLNVYYINKGQAPVHNAYTTAQTFFRVRQVGVTQTDMDADVIRSFEANLKQQPKDNGSTLGVDAALWSTPGFPFPLTQQMVDAILSGQLVLYVASHARWKDSYDRLKETEDCVWLVPPTTPRPPHETLVWHECSR